MFPCGQNIGTLHRASYSTGVDRGKQEIVLSHACQHTRQPPPLPQGIPEAPGREEAQVWPYMVLGDLGEPEDPHRMPQVWEEQRYLVAWSWQFKAFDDHRRHLLGQLWLNLKNSSLSSPLAGAPRTQWGRSCSRISSPIERRTLASRFLKTVFT